MTSRIRPLGVSAISLFFMFGAIMSGLAAVMLLFPGGPLDSLWRLNPHAHKGFATLGMLAVLLMAAVCVACATAAFGLWHLKRSGLLTAIAILVINLAGDTANAFLTHDRRTLIGLPIGVAMIVYLLARRRVFAQ